MSWYLPHEQRWRHIQARVVFNRHRRLGLIGPHPAACQRCGHIPSESAPKHLRISAHHADYGQPLSVEWLCYPCHLEADKEVRARIRLERRLA